MDVFGLLLDMDDVLYDDSLWRRWLFQLLGRLGLHADFRDFFRVWQRNYLDEVHRGKRDFWEALRTYLISAGLTPAQTDEVLAAAHARRRQLLQAIRPLPGVRATTAQLNATGVPLGILCNAPWPGEKISQMLHQLGLANRFQPVICSRDCGWAKPYHASYCTALSAMKLAPVDVAFVGHDADELAGAKAVGMPTIAFNYDEDARADIYLEHFDQLLSRIRYRTTRVLAG